MKRAKEADVLRVVKWLVETKHADLGLGEGAVAIVASRYGMEKVAAYLTYDERQDKANKAEADLLAILAAEEDGDSKKKQHHQGRQRKKGRARRRQDNGSRTQQP